MAHKHIINPAKAPFLDLPSRLLDNATILTIKPMKAKGILIQFKAPKQGIKPTSIPNRANIPKTKLAVFKTKDS